MGALFILDTASHQGRFRAGKEHQSDAIYPEHLLQSLLMSDPESSVGHIMRSVGQSFDELVLESQRTVYRSDSPIRTPVYANTTRAILKNASKIASEMRFTFTEPEHLLLALLTTPGAASEMLSRYGFEYGKVRDLIISRNEGLFSRGTASTIEEPDLGAFGIGSVKESPSPQPAPSQPEPHPFAYTNFVNLAKSRQPRCLSILVPSTISSSLFSIGPRARWRNIYSAKA